MVTMELQRHGLMGQKGYHIQMLIMVVLKEHRAGAPFEISSNAGTPSNGRCMAVDYDDLMISTSGPIGGLLPDKLAPSPANGLW